MAVSLLKRLARPLVHDWNCSYAASCVRGATGPFFEFYAGSSLRGAAGPFFKGRRSESEEHLKVLSNVQGSRRPVFDLLFRCDYLRHTSQR